MQGKSVNSSKFFKDNLYFADINQVYLYKNKSQWNITRERSNNRWADTFKSKSLL